MIYSPQTAFCFTNLSRLVLEIFRFSKSNSSNELDIGSIGVGVAVEVYKGVGGTLDVMLHLS